MTYLKFRTKTVVIKTVNLSVNLKELKITNSYDCKNCRKEQLKPRNKLIKKFSNAYEFIMEKLTSLFLF